MEQVDLRHIGAGFCWQYTRCLCLLDTHTQHMVSTYPSEVLPYGVQLLSLSPQSNQRLCLYPLGVFDHLCTCMASDGHWSDNETQAAVLRSETLGELRS